MRDAGFQMRRGGAVARANLEEMIAEACAGEYAWQEITAAERAPEGRGAEEMFEGVHGGLRGWEPVYRKGD